MGSFWGLDNAGKEAQGWPREFGAWTSQQFKDWLAHQNEAYSAGDSATRWNKDWNLTRARNGIGSVADIQNYGKQIMPGIDHYVQDRHNTATGQINDYKTNVPQSPEVMAKIRDINNKNLEYIDQTRNANLTDIGDTYHRGFDANKAAYDKLDASSDTAYKTALDNTELLKPGSRFQEAQAARAFAGQTAQTAGALRRMGVADTPQGLSAMQRVYTDRSRAMDDAAAAGTAGYVAAKNNLTIGQQQDREGLGKGRLSNELNLDANRSSAYRGTQDTAMDRITANQDQAQGNEVLGKSMATNDWQTIAGLQDKYDAATREGIDLNNQAWNLGMNYNNTNLQEKNTGADNVGNYGDKQLNYALQSGQMARGYGNDAMDAYKTAYGYEAPQAGWGAKMLMSMAQMGLSAIPGVGPMLSAATGPLVGAGQTAVGAGGYGQGGPGGGYNPAGGPMNSTYGSQPYGMSQGGVQPYSLQRGGAGSPASNMTDLYAAYKNYRLRPTTSGSTNLYDPSKTVTNADGSLTVGRY